VDDPDRLGLATGARPITAKFLVADDGLNVKRSSFVCVVLARLPDVQIMSRRPIELRLPSPSGA